MLLEVKVHGIPLDLSICLSKPDEEIETEHKKNVVRDVLNPGSSDLNQD